MQKSNPEHGNEKKQFCACRCGKRIAIPGMLYAYVDGGEAVATRSCHDRYLKERAKGADIPLPSAA